MAIKTKFIDKLVFTQYNIDFYKIYFKFGSYKKNKHHFKRESYK